MTAHCATGNCPDDATPPRPLTLVSPMQRCLVHDESFTTVCRGCRSEDIAAEETA